MDISGTPGRPKAPQTLSFIAALWATVVALFFLFGPTYGTSTSEYSVTTSGGQVASPQFEGHATGLEVNGPRVAFVLVIPIILALLPLAVRKHQRASFIIAGALSLAFCVVGAMSVGMFYLPSALLLLLAGAAIKSLPHAI
ncbi:MAG TPA: hypothetical protein VK560_01225 [Gemmatimonadaceae bacterium]|jgi:hypothetical protein|nr:hypothetical protein [Gemmatimonadaceae bacterium]